MKLGHTTVSLRSLILPDWLASEMRVRINQPKVRQYAEEMGDSKFPEPVVFVDPKTERYLVGDGFHRILAHQLNLAKTVHVDLRRGQLLDACLWNIESNRNQKGMPFSSGDLGRCIITLLVLPESKDWSQMRIAETVGCSQGYVSQVTNAFVQDGGERPKMILSKNGVMKSTVYPDRAEVEERRVKVLELFAEGLPKIEIARRIGVARFSVQRIIKNEAETGRFVVCPHCNGTGMVSNIS